MMHRVLAACFVLAAWPAFGLEFAVNQTADTNDGVCAEHCSLREAIVAANANPGADSIVIPAGTFALSLGPLAIDDALAIEGEGVDATIVDGGGTDVFDFDTSGGIGSLEGLTVRNGTIGLIVGASTFVSASDLAFVNNGTGIFANGPLALQRTTVRYGSASVGIFLGATATVFDSAVDGAGGGSPVITNASDVEIENSTVHGGFVAMGVASGSLALRRVTISGASLGIDNLSLDPVDIEGSIVADNLQACRGAIQSLDFNVDDDGSCGFAEAGDQSNVGDAGLAPLANYGGRTPTRALCTSAGEPDATCGAASPALDAGGTCTPMDQRGLLRPRGASCDAGAYEALVPPLDAYVAYKARSARASDGGTKLPKRFQLQLDNQALDNGDNDDPEAFRFKREVGIAHPAALDERAAPNLAPVSYARFMAREGSQSIAAPVDGRFAKPARHARRRWELSNGLGTIAVDSLRVNASWIPAGASDSFPAPDPGSMTSYICYKTKVVRAERTQTPGGRLRRDLQVFTADRFDDCATFANGDVSFAGTAAEGKCLFSLGRVTELCVPAALRNLTGGRLTDAEIEESDPFTDDALLCYKPKLARKVRSADAANLLGVAVDSSVNAQRRHDTRRAKDGNPLYVQPGAQVPSPSVVETKKVESVCIPTTIDSVAMIP